MATLPSITYSVVTMTTAGNVLAIADTNTLFFGQYPQDLFLIPSQQTNVYTRVNRTLPGTSSFPNIVYTTYAGFQTSYTLVYSSTGNFFGNYAKVEKLVIRLDLTQIPPLSFGLTGIRGGKKQAGKDREYRVFYVPFATLAIDLAASDSINNLVDSIVTSSWPNLTINPSDSINNFVELLAMDFVEKYLYVADHLTSSYSYLADSAVVRLNLPPEVLKTFSDQLFLYDIFNLQLDGADALIQFADAISIFYLQDSVNLQLDYLLQQSEELQQLSEELQVASPIAVYAYDTLMYNWDDSVATGFIMVLQVADTIDSLLDSIQAVISTTVLPVSVADQLQALSDSVTKLRLSYEKFVKDQIIVLSDTYAGQMHHFLRSAEQLEALLERIVLDSGGTSFADGLTLNDGVTVQLAGFSTGEFSDALSLNDAVSVALGPVALTLTLSDSINNLADANTRSIATPLLTLNVADSINNLVDSISANQLAFGTNVVSRIRRYLGDMQG